VVARQELAPAQLRPMLAAILATIAIPSEQERVGDLATESAGDVDEADEANDGGGGEGSTFRMKYSVLVDLEYLRFPVYDEAKRSSYRQYCQRFKRSIQCQTPHALATSSFKRPCALPCTKR
jgi:hypothetical protein